MFQRCSGCTCSASAITSQTRPRCPRRRGRTFARFCCQFGSFTQMTRSAYTALAHAAKAGHTDIVRRLCEAKAAVRDITTVRFTATVLNSALWLQNGGSLLHLSHNAELVTFCLNEL